MTPTKIILPKKYDTFYVKVSIRSLILMEISFSNMITPKILHVFSPSKQRTEPTLGYCIVVTFALYSNVTMDVNNIFVITKNIAVTHGNISQKAIIISLTKSSGLKSINYGNKSEILTYIKRI